MPAVYLIEPHTLVLADSPPAEPGPGECLVSLRYGGICGTDLHGFAGDNPFLTLPRIPGHELSGVVVEGDGLPVGTPVAINPMITCGRCRPCRVGRRNCCVDMQVLGVHVDGGFRSEMVVPTTMLHPLPANVPLEAGALVEPLSIGANACARGGVTAGQTVLIQGAGAIGLSCLLLARARGARTIITDRLASRLALAERLGADAVIRVGVDDEASRVRELTNWDGPDVVIEATGRIDVLRTSFDLVAAAGTVVSLAITRDSLSLPVTDTMIRKELDFRGSRLNCDRFGEVIDLLAAGTVDAAPLVTHQFDLADAGDAYATALAEPETTVKVLLRLS